MQHMTDTIQSICYLLDFKPNPNTNHFGKYEGNKLKLVHKIQNLNF